MSDTNEMSMTIARLSATQSTLATLKADAERLVQRMASMQIQTAQELAQVTQELKGTVGYRKVSSIDDAAFAERQAGKGAVIDFVKANHLCELDSALSVWKEAALALRPEKPWLLHESALGLFKEYAYNAMELGYIPNAEWESFRQLLVTAPKELLMGM